MILPSADLCMTCIAPIQDMYSKILARRVKELKETQKGVDIMCDKLNELIAEERNEGEKRGILIGEAQGEKRGILHTQKKPQKICSIWEWLWNRFPWL